MTRLILPFAALLLLAACATTKAPPLPINIADIDAFLAEQDYIRAGLLDGSLGEYEPDEVAEVIRRQDQLRNVLGGVATIDELSEPQQIIVLNAQGTINGILTDSLRDVPICARERVVGSNRMRTVCLSARQREHLRDASQESLRYLQESFMPREGG